jgi:hypothetical protein
VFESLFKLRTENGRRKILWSPLVYVPRKKTSALLSKESRSSEITLRNNY